MKRRKLIYLDNASSTEMDRRVVKAMKPYLSEKYANPSAIHIEGVEVRNDIEEARRNIAKLIYAHSDEILFTGSATESINLAIFGSIETKQNPHIITTNIEHPAVLESCRYLESKGLAEVSYLEVDERGILDPKLLRNEIKENTVLISIHYVNSEIGVIQDISEIAKEIRHFRKSNSSVYPLLHTDAVQAMNYLDISNIEKLGVDMMSFNGSKIYGPKGIGVLYKKRNISLAPHIFGGGQEMGLRSGTENVMAIIGLSKALEITSLIREKEVTRLRILQDYIYEEIKNISKRVGFKMLINGDMEKRIPNNINISIEGISSELMVILLDACDVAISEKSACKSDDDSDSHVISALRKNDFTKQAIRISMGRNTTLGDIKYFLSSLEQILGKYKSFVI